MKKQQKIIGDAAMQAGEKNDEAIVFANRVPIEKLRMIWNDADETYTDEQLYLIRDWLYTMSGVIISVSENITSEDATFILVAERERTPKKEFIIFNTLDKKVA